MRVLYRAVLSVSRTWLGYHCNISYEEWRVVRETPKGTWISTATEQQINTVPDEKNLPRLRWVSASTRFCYPTQEEAAYNLYQRKKSHVRHARRRLKAAEAALDFVRPFGESEEECPPKEVRLFPLSGDYSAKSG